MEVRHSWTTFVSISDHLVSVSIVQAWYYYTHQNDDWVLKSLVPFMFFWYMSAKLTRCHQVAAVMTFDTAHQALITHCGKNSLYWIPALDLGPDSHIDSLHLHNYELGRPRRAAETSLVTFISIPQINGTPITSSVGACWYAKYSFCYSGPHMCTSFALGWSVVQCKLHWNLFLLEIWHQSQGLTGFLIQR